MKCTFYGVTGAHPAFSPAVTYGNTSCVLLDHDDFFLIFDAGSGLQQCEASVDLSLKPMFIFLSHFHYDHVLGLLFLKQLHTNTHPIYIVHPSPDIASSVFSSLFNPNLFPISLSTLKNYPKFIHPDECSSFSINIESFELNHNGKSYAYKMSQNNKTFIYATDNALTDNNTTHFIRFFNNASILIHDCFFYNENKLAYKSWGHSFLDQCLNVGLLANVDHLCLFHHKPYRSKANFISMRKDIDLFLAKHKEPFKCYLTTDGFELVL